MQKLVKSFVCFVFLLVIFYFTMMLGFADAGKVVTNADTLNLREAANTSSKVLSKIPYGTELSIVDSCSGWYKVNFKGTTGWISTSFVTLKQSSIGTASVSANDVNVRGGYSTNAAVVSTLSKGTKVNILDRHGEWYKVKTPDATVGWIFGNLLSVKTDNVSRSGNTVSREKAPVINTNVTNSSKGQQIVDYGKKFLGVRYVYGGSSPSGFDCSGFVKYIFDHHGIYLERVASGQANCGQKVSKSNLQPGDLVFFDTNGGHDYINHVGVYIGLGKFMHASSGRASHKVTISDINSGFYANAYMTARRVVK